MKIVLHELAEKELVEAAEYYENVGVGLGVAFLDEFERAARSLTEFPGSAPFIRSNLRRKLFHRFPYGIVYSASDDAVRILAVMNLSRRPFYWVGRK